MMRHDLCIGVALALVAIDLYLAFGRRSRSWRKNSPLRRAGSLIVALGAIGMACYALFGGLMFLDPSYSDQVLLGLTPDQVVAKLGPADIDPRQHGWTDGDPNNPLLLDYEWNMAGTIVEFKDGHVIHIWKSWK